MKKAYVSSTYKDLVQHREAVARVLRQADYQVVCMEDYVARDDRTVDACRNDLMSCDIYVGIFAYRYGHVPSHDNDRKLSITELEYRQAREEKTCLLFLVSDEAPWPSRLRDSETGEGDDGRRIRALRAELSERCAGYFSTPDELAKEVLLAVREHESTRRVQRLPAAEEIKQAAELGASYLPNLEQRILEARDTELIELSLGPVPWWTTRLHLVAALASDFTAIRQIVFLDAEGRYLLMAPPLEIRRALTRKFPELERVYLESRSRHLPAGWTEAEDIQHIVAMYPTCLATVYGKDEESVKQVVAPAMLTRDLRIESHADAVERTDQPQRQAQWEILRRKTPFVAVVERGKLKGVVDRVQLASDVAVRAIEELRG